VVEPAIGKTKAGRDSLCFEIRQLSEDLLSSEPCGKKIKDVTDPCAKPGT